MFSTWQGYIFFYFSTVNTYYMYFNSVVINITDSEFILKVTFI